MWSNENFKNKIAIQLNVCIFVFSGKDISFTHNHMT